MYLTSLQAENTFTLMRRLAGYLSRQLELEVRYEDAGPWQERARRLYGGDILVGMICSRPYALQSVAPDRSLEGVVAPVYQGSLYGGKPVYYSYLVTNRAHPATGLRDLAGTTVAFNEPASQSGYFSLRTGLADVGRGPDFFGMWLESGAHVRSIELLAAHRADAAAIDSTLWDYLAVREPARLAELKVIETLGPYPAPPLTAHVSLSRELHERLSRLLTNMHEEPEGRAILDEGLVERFVPVEEAPYKALIGRLA